MGAVGFMRAVTIMWSMGSTPVMRAMGSMRSVPIMGTMGSMGMAVLMGFIVLLLPEVILLLQEFQQLLPLLRCQSLFKQLSHIVTMLLHPCSLIFDQLAAPHQNLCQGVFAAEGLFAVFQTLKMGAASAAFQFCSLAVVRTLVTGFG
jgi:hypothetical protein